MRRRLTEEGIACLENRRVLDLGSFYLAGFTDVDNQSAEKIALLTRQDLDGLAGLKKDKPLFAMMHWGREFADQAGPREQALAALLEDQGRGGHHRLPFSSRRPFRGDTDSPAGSFPWGISFSTRTSPGCPGCCWKPSFSLRARTSLRFTPLRTCSASPEPPRSELPALARYLIHSSPYVKNLFLKVFFLTRPWSIRLRCDGFPAATMVYIPAENLSRQGRERSRGTPRCRKRQPYLRRKK